MYIGFIFNIIFIINYFFISEFNIKINNKNKLSKFEQIIGSPEENTIYRSFMSSHHHRNFLHLIKNSICLNIIFYLLTTITNWYTPIIIFYLSLITDHFVMEIIKFKRVRIIGSSGCILGLYGFYFSYVLTKIYNNTININNIHIFNNTININNIHIFSLSIILLLFLNLIRNFNDEIKKEKNNTSDTSHFIGFIIGLFYGIIFNLI